MIEPYQPTSDPTCYAKQFASLRCLCLSMEKQLKDLQVKYDVAYFYAQTLDPISIKQEKDINTMLTNALDYAEDEITKLRKLLIANGIKYD